MSGLIAGRVTKQGRDQRAKNRSVVRMMAIMQDGNSQEVPKEFLETGRTGRRNAMPDILHPQGVEASTADLPSRLENLGTKDSNNQEPSTSKTNLEIKNNDETKGNSCS